MVIFEQMLLKNKNSRKIFGKEEIKIIRKQINGIELTQSEKNRLSRDIRPKFEFIKEVSSFSNMFGLKKGQAIEEINKKAVEIILKDKLSKDIDSILLFGSHADNSAHFNSDIDICVVFKRYISEKESTLFRMRCLGELNDKMDLHVFEHLPKKIKQSIAKNHKVLFQSSKFDNIMFTITELKNRDYFIRMKNIFGAQT